LAIDLSDPKQTAEAIEKIAEAAPAGSISCQHGGINKRPIHADETTPILMTFINTNSRARSLPHAPRPATDAQQERRPDCEHRQRQRRRRPTRARRNYAASKGASSPYQIGRQRAGRQGCDSERGAPGFITTDMTMYCDVIKTKVKT